MNPRLVLMGMCCALFFGRVLGQIMVGLYSPEWLPPMDAWYSGLLPYPLLLPAQLALLMLMATIINDQARHGNSFPRRHPNATRWLRAAAGAYATVMAVRYLIAIQITDVRHWYDGGVIPIVFHWVLAGFIWLSVAGSKHRGICQNGCAHDGGHS